MTFDSFEQYKDILIEDLKTYINSLKNIEKDIGFCIILSNRLITNAVVLNQKEYVLLGAILKEITLDLNNILDENNLEKAIEILLKILKKYIEKERILDSNEILEDYNDYFSTYRELIVSPFSEYSENKDFTIFFTKYCITFFVKDLKDHEIPLNLDVLIFGTMSEINRVIKTHGCIKQQLILRLILSFFGRTYDYYRILLSSENISDKWSEEYLNLKNQLIDNITSFSLEDSYIKSSLEFLFCLCKEWRLMFIRLLEIPRTRMVEKSILIPDNIKKDLDEKISRLIESKMEGSQK